MSRRRLTARLKFELDGTTYKGYYSLHRNTLKVTERGSKTTAPRMTRREDVLADVILDEPRWVS